MAKKRHEESETLIGVVTPVGWEEDRVSEIALSATDDEEYYIENGEKFINLLQQCIEATGKVNRSKKAFRSILIKRFKVLESISPPED
jgi:hypothetical protein